MVDLNWCGDWPSEVRAAVEPHLHRWLVILPGWCAEVVVRWNPDCAEASMRTHVRPEYRDTVLEVCPNWLEMNEASRELTVMHEMMHVAMGPLVNFTRNTIRDLTEPDTMIRGVLDRACTEAFEGCVEDLARAARRVASRSLIPTSG